MIGRRPTALTASAGAVVVLAAAFLTATGAAHAGSSEVVKVAIRDPVAVAADGTRNLVYVSSRATNTVAVVNGATRQVIGSIPRPVGGSPVALAVNVQTNRIYDLDAALNRLVVYNGANGGVLAQVGVPATPQSVAVNPTTNRIYVTSSAADGAGVLSVIDGTLSTVLATTGLPPKGARGVAVDTSDGRIFVALSDTDRLAVLSGQTNQLVATLPTGDAPTGVAIDSKRHVVYVANRDADSLTVAKRSTNGSYVLFPAVAIGDVPLGVAVNETTGRVYVANAGSGQFPSGSLAGSVSVVEPQGAAPTFVEVERVTLTRFAKALTIDGANHRVFVASESVDPKVLHPGSVSVVSRFDPLAHGFHFPNSFTGAIIVTVPGYGHVNLASHSFGLCGGMALAALDAYLAGGASPSNTTAPGQGSQLRGHLYNRLLDTLRPDNWRIVRRFATWMTLPIDNKPGGTGLRTLTAREYVHKIHPKIRLGQPVPLGLVKADHTRSIWSNHQVLAIGDFQDAQGRWVIEVYDPNYKDTVTYLHIDRRVQTSDPAGNNRLESRRWRGFFAIPYGFKQPYWVAPVVWP